MHALLMFGNYSIILLLVFFSLSGAAASSNLISPQISGKTGAEVVSLWEVTRVDEKLISNVQVEFEIQSKNVENVKFYVPQNRLQEFLSMVPNAKQINTDISSDLKSMFQSYSTGTYRDINKVYLALMKLESQYSDVIKLVEYGKSKGSASRRVKVSRLIALKFSDNVKVNESETKLLFTAATHGDELVTTESLLRYMEKLIVDYKNGASYALNLINNFELYFVPVVNPDGFRHQTRYIADGTDPNRSYPFVNIEGHNSNQAQCIEELISLHSMVQFDGTVDFHAYGELILLPYADTVERVENFDQYFELAYKMVPNRNYQVSQISHHRGIGVVYGSSVDYFSTNGSISYGIELARRKAPRTERKVNKSVDDVAHIIKVFSNSFR